MSPNEFRYWLNGLHDRQEQDLVIRHKICTWKSYSRTHYRIYRNWWEKKMDLYPSDELQEEAARLNTIRAIVPERFVPDYA